MRYNRPISLWLRIALGAVTLALIAMLIHILTTGVVPVKNGQYQREEHPGSYYAGVVILVAEIAFLGFLTLCPSRKK